MLFFNKRMARPFLKASLFVLVLSFWISDKGFASLENGEDQSSPYSIQKQFDTAFKSVLKGSNPKDKKRIKEEESIENVNSNPSKIAKDISFYKKKYSHLKEKYKKQDEEKNHQILLLKQNILKKEEDYTNSMTRFTLFTLKAEEKEKELLKQGDLLKFLETEKISLARKIAFDNQMLEGQQITIKQLQAQLEEKANEYKKLMTNFSLYTFTAEKKEKKLLEEADLSKNNLLELLETQKKSYAEKITLSNLTLDKQQKKLEQLMEQLEKKEEDYKELMTILTSLKLTMEEREEDLMNQACIREQELLKLIEKEKELQAKQGIITQQEIEKHQEISQQLKEKLDKKKESKGEAKAKLTSLKLKVEEFEKKNQQIQINQEELKGYHKYNIEMLQPTRLVNNDHVKSSPWFLKPEQLRALTMQCGINFLINKIQ